MNRFITAIGFSSFLLLFHACGAEQGSEEHIPPAALEMPTPTSTSWYSSDVDVVATVNDVPITVENVRLMQRAKPSQSSFESLEEAIVTELLAQEGVRNLPTTAQTRINKRFKEALIQRVLHVQLEEELTTENIPDRYLNEAYNRMKRSYDHYDIFFFRDMLLVCCRAGSAFCLSHQDDYKECFERTGKLAKEVHKIVTEKLPESGDDFEALFLQAQKAAGDELRFQKYSFYYDVKRSYDENVNVTRFTRPITEAALTMKVGTVHPPIRDEYGWHVVFLEKHVPEASRTLADPEVKTEISKNIYAKVQENEFRVLLNETAGKHELRVYRERLSDLAKWLQVSASTP